MTKYIKLTQNQTATVDNDVYEFLSQWKWQAKFDKKRGSYYALRTEKRMSGKIRKTILMHVVVLHPEKGRVVDHIDGNTLNNTKSNLRECTHSQNLMNRGKTKSNTSGYKGVFKRGNKWISQIKADGKIYYLGRFDDISEAAKAYDSAAKRLHGKFASLNF